MHTDDTGIEQPAIIDLYWRPGCPFCSSLIATLERHDVPMRMHNIWEDETAAAVVRSVARGNETVPTVVIAGVGLVNPSAAQVTKRFMAEFPDAPLRAVPARRGFLHRPAGRLA